MKKFMKKKISFFGKEVSVFVVVLLAVGLVSAALVPYLSGLVVGTTSVSSPFQARIAEGIQEWNYAFIKTDISSDVVGGETLESTLNFKYLGTKNGVKVTEVFMINNTGITCGDFSSIIFDSGNGNVSVPLDVEDWCTEHDNEADGIMDYIVISDRPFNIYDAGEANNVKVWLTFELNAYGDYKLSAQIIPYEGS